MRAGAKIGDDCCFVGVVSAVKSGGKTAALQKRAALEYLIHSRSQKSDENETRVGICGEIGISDAEL